MLTEYGLAGMSKSQSPAAARIAIVGLSHDHVNWFFDRPERGDIDVIGVCESNPALVQRYVQQRGLRPDLVYTDLGTMLDTAKPQAVMAFGAIFDHLAVVEACAPRGVHVMVEKPLAVSLAHAQKIQALAQQYGIHVLTNYETSWYPSNHAVWQQVCQGRELGDIRKMVVHDGHWGPKELGCSTEFLSWLTDPVLNGGGALIDFGCYGANLMTWLMGNCKPLTVTAVTQQIKPDIYPKVDDEATIILTYPHAQGIIQASWNWPTHRKDMEVYGPLGYLHAVDRVTLRKRMGQRDIENTLTLPAATPPVDDVFAFLAAFLQGEAPVGHSELASLHNNMIVVEILEAARNSARTGQTVHLQ